MLITQGGNKQPTRTRTIKNNPTQSRIVNQVFSLIFSILAQTHTGACFPGLPLFFLPFTSGSSISLMLILRPTASVAPDSLDESLRAEYKTHMTHMHSKAFSHPRSKLNVQFQNDR